MYDKRFCCAARRNQASQLGLHALAAALADVGKGEELRNNAGPYVWGLTGRRTSGAWCAAAVWTWIDQGAIRLCRPTPITRTHSARRLCAAIAATDGGSETTDPLPGDIVLWSRGTSRWQGHVGIVESVRGMAFTSVEGNRGRFPATVGVFTHSMAERRLLGFYRLP